MVPCLLELISKYVSKVNREPSRQELTYFCFDRVTFINLAKLELSPDLEL